MDEQQQETERATRVLLPGSKITAESIIKLFETMTGRKATEEEIAKVKSEWEDEE